MENINLIGKFYDPCDNSYCIDSKGKKSYLAPWYDSNRYNPTKHELNARFEIVSNPYKEKVVTYSKDLKECIFIKVKSNITGEIYRVLYYENCVIDTYKDYIILYNKNNHRYDENHEIKYPYMYDEYQPF